MMWNGLAPVLLPCPDLVRAPSCAAPGSRSLKDESHFLPQMLLRAGPCSRSLVSHLSEGKKGFTALPAGDAGRCSDCVLRNILAMPGQASSPFFLPGHGHAVTSLQAVALMGKYPAHTGFNGALEEGSSYRSFCAGLISEEMLSTMLAHGYCRVHCRETTSTTSSPVSRPLQQLLQSCSWAVLCSPQGAILEEQGMLKHGCQMCADVPRVAGVVESQHVTVNLGGDGSGSSALAEAARACGYQRSWIPTFLSAVSLTGWRYRLSRVYGWDPAASRG